MDVGLGRCLPSLCTAARNVLELRVYWSRTRRVHRKCYNMLAVVSGAHPLARALRACRCLGKHCRSGLDMRPQLHQIYQTLDSQSQPSTA
eukprot:2429110-Pleurochrysis_carterae.AAC.1